jgi:outer membrane protein OmpA-like peptidoglycan-associated protein
LHLVHATLHERINLEGTFLQPGALRYRRRILPSIAIAAPASAGPDWAIDVAGGADHPLIQRYKNSWMMAYKRIGFDQTTFPGKLGLDSQSSGKIGLYGIYFDTGKADIKAAESKSQLDEMAKLLKSQPALKVYIVGHTDNQALSQQRAQAVVTTLARQYQIAPNRLASKGVASLAPVASNADEAGRAMNRRVGLVVQ